MCSLVSTIESAFAGIRCPATDNIDTGECPESLDIRAMLEEDHWRFLSARQLRGISCYFLTPAAIHYLLPAWMIATINDYKEADVIPDQLIDLFDVMARQPAGNKRELAQVVEFLTSEQRIAIHLFLRYLHDEYREDFEFAQVHPGELADHFSK
jgi:hypothetical protein